MRASPKINIGVDNKQKNVISRAAELSGLTITQYVLGLVLPDAERRITEETRIRPTEMGCEAFAESRDEPMRDLSELRALLNRKSRFHDSSF
jgi:uncharacterized protein (DUF1778 family)